MSELPSEKRDALSVDTLAVWAAFFIVFFIVTIIISTGFWVGLLLFVISLLLFIDLGFKFQFTSTILTQNFSSYYDQKVSPLGKFGKKFYIISFSVLVLLFSLNKIIDSAKEDITGLLETRNEMAIIDTLNYFLHEIDTTSEDNLKKVDKFKQNISYIISFSLKNKLSKVKNDIEEKILSSLRDSSVFDDSVIDSTLKLYKEERLVFNKHKDLFSKVGGKYFANIISLCDPKVLNEEFINYLRNELKHFRNTDTSLVVDCDPIYINNLAKMYEIKSILESCRINLDSKINTLIESMYDFELAKANYESVSSYLPSEPFYVNPVYDGVYYLSGAYIGKFFDIYGILVQSGDKYYIVAGASGPANPNAAIVGGYVKSIGQKTFQRNGRSRTGIVVSQSDIESYREDQAAFAEKIKNAQENYAFQLNNYRESLQKYNESKSKKIALKSLADQLASVMVANIQEIL